MKTLYTDYNIGNKRNQDFEFIILESALENIVNKFKYNLSYYFLFLISCLTPQAAPEDQASCPGDVAAADRAPTRDHRTQAAPGSEEKSVGV